MGDRELLIICGEHLADLIYSYCHDEDFSIRKLLKKGIINNKSKLRFKMGIIKEIKAFMNFIEFKKTYD